MKALNTKWLAMLVLPVASIYGCEVQSPKVKPDNSVSTDSKTETSTVKKVSSGAGVDDSSLVAKMESVSSPVSTSSNVIKVTAPQPVVVDNSASVAAAAKAAADAAAAKAASEAAAKSAAEAAASLAKANADLAAAKAASDAAAALAAKTPTRIVPPGFFFTNTSKGYFSNGQGYVCSFSNMDKYYAAGGGANPADMGVPFPTGVVDEGECGTGRFAFSCNILMTDNGWNPSLPLHTWFKDDYQNSGSDARRCLGRAQEYFFYYGLLKPGSFVNAAFNMGGQTVAAQQFRGQGGLTNYGFNWSPVK